MLKTKTQSCERTEAKRAKMPNLSAFPITKRWPAKHSDRLQLYSLPTPNGVKVSIMLEEIGLPYEVHLVDFNKDDQKTPEFLSLNPNGKIPAILDPDGPGGKPLPLFESGAILQYLAEKTGKLLPDDAARRWQTIQWVHFQMGGIGPMFGQVGFFHKFAGKDYEDKRPLERYVAETKRLLGVMETRLAVGNGSWTMITASPTFPCSAGCATWLASTARANWWRSMISRMSRLGSNAVSPGPPWSVD
jgi:GSH-dependent disulfide-bond oxidoreductase